jgi:UDP-N-acetylmuramoyl-L-alanyl-D-glutamate--2,6-diaminopimelate ligase
MLLSKLFDIDSNVEITGLSLDSRTVKAGDMFFCIEGLEADGHDYAGKAVAAGAVAVVHRKDIERAPGAVYIKTDDVRKELNRVCDLFNGRPSSRLTVFGTTGTNGKSTISSIISDIYSTYKPCGYMGTIAVRYGEVSKLPSLTTPDQIELHSDLREMVEHGMEAVAMEVSSHGLSMGRVDAVDFDCAIFTNLTYDHLDYHKTMENYFEAKKLLFKMMKPDRVCVLNADDELSIEGLKECCRCRFVTYGTGVLGAADYMAEDIEFAGGRTTFTLVYKGKKYPAITNMVALYNIYNLLGAIAAMHEMGMELEKILPLIENIPQVDGRMERVDLGQDFTVIVDYAHTPDGYEKVFSYGDVVTRNGGDIYAVFGCPGKRDKVKRRVMGKIAGSHCRTAIVTEQDPRNESAEEIGAMILEGVKESGCEGIFVGDREGAIERAIAMAHKGDLVLILGKGDESYMYYEEGRRPWIGDNEAARRALKKVMAKDKH